MPRLLSCLRPIDSAHRLGMDYLTQEYLGMIKDSNECLKKFNAHIVYLESTIKELRAELKEKDDKLFFYMKKDSFTISRHEFSTFVAVVKNRRETDKEWELFQETFRSNIKLEIYAWLDALP